MFQEAQNLAGSALSPGQTFHFACKPGLACFNSCCSHKRLPLLPYDLLRLRRGLSRPSQEILAELVTLETDPVSGWPALRLSLDERGVCPLLGREGCRVYSHRPTACRIFPLARAVRPNPLGGPPEEIFLVPDKDPSCLGWGQDRELSLAGWISDQGLAEHFAAHDRLLNLLAHPARTGRVALDQRQTHAVIMALYNLDVFRLMLDQPGFAAKAGLSEAALATALQSDEALLELGESWLAALLFGSEALKG